MNKIKNLLLVFAMIFLLSGCTKNTVEEKILQLQEQKRLTADVFNNVSERLTIDDIKQLIDE